MHGVFDEGELEPAKQRRDTELTLGPTMLLGVFFGMVLLCGLFFGLGFAVGRYGPSDSPAAGQQPATGAQASAPAASARLKPSATVPEPPQRATVNQPPSGSSSANPATNPQYSNQAAGPGNSSGPPQVRPALPAMATSIQPTPAHGGGLRVEPATAPTLAIMVQIAAVSHPEDAEVLVNALRRRGYAVNVRRETSDSLLHVQIGPFNNRNDANAMRQKLLNDGYNAIVQP